MGSPRPARQRQTDLEIVALFPKTYDAYTKVRRRALGPYRTFREVFGVAVRKRA